MSHIVSESLCSVASTAASQEFTSDGTSSGHSECPQLKRLDVGKSSIEGTPTSLVVDGEMALIVISLPQVEQALCKLPSQTMAAKFSGELLFQGVQDLVYCPEIGRGTSSPHHL